MRLPARLVAGLLAGVALVAGGAVDAANASGSVTSIGEPTTVLAVAPRAGGILESGGSLSVIVSIANTGPGTLAAGSLSLGVDPTAITSATALTARIAHPTESGYGYLVGKPTATPVIPPGGEQRVQVTIPASALTPLFGATPIAGARVLSAELRDGSTTVAVGAAAFTVVGGGFSAPVTVGTIVPITAPATRTGLLSADQLSDLTGEFGAWTEALDAAESTQAVLAIDPMVLASITTLGSAAPQSARDFLTELQQVPNDTFALPYGDSDISLERAAGADSVLRVTSLAGNVSAGDFVGLPAPTDSASVGPSAAPSSSSTPTPTPTATSSVAGVPSTAQLLDFPYTSTSIAWPYAGSVSVKDLSFLKASKLPTAVLSSADVKDSTARQAAGPLATVSGSTALIADSTLSSLLVTASGPETSTAARAALSQLLATLAIDASTGTAPTVLMTASRVDEDTTTLPRVLADITGQPWIHSAGLQHLLAQELRPAVKLKSEGVSAPRLTGGAALLAADAHVRRLAEAVSPSDTFLGPQRLKLLALLSNAWQGDPTWSAAAKATAESLKSTASGQVTISLSKTVRIIGSDGTLPVSIVNKLSQSVTVVVRAEPSNAKMTIGAGERTTIPGGSVATVKLPVKVISNGTARLALEVETPGGWQLSSETVAVTLNAGWETIGAVVITVALLALFGTGVYRNVTKRRRALRRSAARRAARTGTAA